MTDGTKTSNKPPFHLTGIWESGIVKTMIEIDDELYPQAKAHASLTGRKMKDLVNHQETWYRIRSEYLGSKPRPLIRWQA